MQLSFSKSKCNEVAYFFKNSTKTIFLKKDLLQRRKMHLPEDDHATDAKINIRIFCGHWIFQINFQEAAIILLCASN